MPTTLVRGDRTTIRAQLKAKDENGTLQTLDLTGAVITFRYKIDQGAVQEKGSADGVTVVGAATNGTVEYEMAVNEITGDQLQYEWKVVDQTGRQFTNQNIIQVGVRAPLS